MDADAVAVDDQWHRVGQALRDPGAGARGGERPRQPEQRPRLVVAPLGLGQRRGAVQRAGRVSRVHLEQLSLLREEPLVGVERREQPPVLTAVGPDRNDKPGLREIG